MLAMALVLRRSRWERIIVRFHFTEGGIAMRIVLIAAFCASSLIVTAGQAAAQQNQATENKDKRAVEKTTDKAKEGAQEVGEKAQDVKDKTVKGSKKAA